MKHLYTLVFAMLIVSFAFAQAPVREYAGRAVNARPAQGQGVDYTRDIIYTNDFSDCSNVSFYNAYDEGYTDYIDGLVNAGEAEVALMEYGPHLPARDVGARVYVLRKIRE